MAEPTVVTLLPAATEIAYALGVEPAAVSHECAHPPAAAERPRATASAVDADASSAEINAQVADPDAVFSFDREVLRAADPDLVVAQGVCDVCAVDHVAVLAVLEEAGLDAEVLTVDAHTLAEVFDSVRRVGEAVGRAAEADRLVADCRARVAAVRERAERAVDEAGRPRVLVADWMDPPMVAGHWVPELAELAGGDYGIAAPGQHAEPRPFDAVVDFDPEVLVVAPCGYDVDHTLAHVDELRGRAGWDSLSAVRDGAVYVMDGELLNCPTPRLVDALETLAHLLHPTAVDGPTARVEALPPLSPS